MQVIVNGQMQELSADTLAAALDELDLGEAVVATALNGDFVPARQRGERPLAPGDRIEIVAPMQGG